VSFILDALRKSEHERQRSAVPGVAQVPFAVRRRETPRWALVAIGLLGSAVLALGVAWWQTTRPGAPRESAAAAPQIERSSQQATPAPAARVTRVEPAQTPPGADEPARAVAPADMAPTTAAQRGAPTVADNPPAAPTPRSAGGAAPTTAPTSATSAAATLPNAAALAAEGIAVPSLKLTLHGFSENPAERFVFINGTRYREGQTLREGPQVVSIERAGVVLSQQGRRFLLAPQ
jgi:general secretion pathway protein B